MAAAAKVKSNLAQCANDSDNWRQRIGGKEQSAVKLGHISSRANYVAFAF